MTQKELAERVGVSRQTMNAIENSRHAPTVAVAIRIADAFHVSVDQLFDLDYAGKPARREQAATAAVDRPQTTVREPIKLKGEHEPSENEAEHQISLASLRGVM